MILQFLLLVLSLASVAIASGDMYGNEPFGGASWDFEKSACKLKWPDTSEYSDEHVQKPSLLQTLMTVENTSTVPSDRAIANYINTFKPAFEAINSRLKTLFVETKIGFVEGRLKSVASLKQNILKYNKSLSSFNDIIGFRVTTRTKTNVLEAKSTITSDVVNFTVKKPVKCYGICPGAGKYRKDGYRRVHIIVEMKEKPAEIQLSTPYMTLFADYTHDLVYKGPFAIANNSDVKNYTLQLAEYYYQLDQTRDGLPSCPKILQTASMKQILQTNLGPLEAQKVYKKLGEPPNACQWWNDLVVNHETEDHCPADKKMKSSSPVVCSSCVILWISYFMVVFITIH